MTDALQADTKPDVLQRLAHYLPSDEVRFASGGIASAGDARLVLEHLRALLTAVRTYLPRYLVTQKAADPRPGKVSGSFHQATIMFADISGFTAMSEKLSALGERGAEEITHHVNAYFTTMLEITGRLGGDLLKFGGDALLVAFFGPQHARRACRAALQMQEAMSRYSQVVTDVGEFSLRMTIGLGTGPLFVAHLGSADGMEYTVMGPGLARMAHAEDQAQAGEIFVDPNTLEAARPLAVTGETRDGCHRLLALEGDLVLTETAEAATATQPPPKSPEADQDLATLLQQIDRTVEQIRALEPFLAPDLLNRIKHDPVLAASRGEGEFRPVTVLFANFYGVEAIIKELGPERAAEITAILNTHFTAMQEIITRYGGVVNKVDSYVVGHRVMALFGAPRAHIDDPARAVRAALEMQEAMASFAQLETSRGVFSLKQRIGINTGRVFAGNVGSIFRREYSVMGDEVNLTARLMAVSQEGQVLISQSTARQTGEAFLVDELPAVKVKGKSQPVANFEVLGLRPQRQGRRERRPLIGRNDEWQQIRAIADEALQQRTQILLLSGDAGLGKSRLVEELTAYWIERDATAYSSAIPSYGRHSPYLPWIDLLRDFFGLTATDSDLERQEKIETRMRATNPDWADWTALIGNLLGVPLEESEFLRSLDGKLRQQGLFRIVLGLLQAEASSRPLLIALDDLQWADEASIRLLDHFAQRLTQLPVLICTAYRPEAENWLPTGTVSHAHTLALTELADDASLELLETLLPTTPRMSDDLKKLILNRAHGNPLFIEEVAYALIENYLELDPKSGTYRARTDLEQVEIPDTVSRVILSRLDRLDEASRNVLRVASVIGREFESWLLSAVYPYRSTQDELDRRLGALTERDLLEVLRPELAYLFRHVLTREVAYESLLYADRRELHRRIGQCIEEQRASQLDEYYEVLAHHYQRAEDWIKTAHHLLKAGEKAQAIYANEDALHHFNLVLGTAERLPDSDDLQVIAYERLGNVQQITGQYNEALESYAQARAILLPQLDESEEKQRRFADLCRQTGHIYEEYRGEYKTALEWVERGLRVLLSQECIETARLYLVGAAVFRREGQFQDAVRWCHLGLEIAERLATEEAQKAAAHAYYLLGTSYRHLGEIEKAGFYYQRSLDTYQTLKDSPGMARAHNNLATFYLYQDDWSRATHHYQEALATLERMGDLFGQAVIANNLGEVLSKRGQLDSARAWYRRGLSIAQELNLGFGVALLRNNLGYTYVRERDWAQGLTHLRQSLEAFQKIGAEGNLPEVHRHLAEAHLGQGGADEALSWAEKSLSGALAAEMKLEEGCTRRVLGSIHHTQNRLEEAEVQLSQSLRILDELESPYEVARTAIQLAALYTDRGNETEASRLSRQAIATFEHLGAELDLSQAQKTE